jgi:hypothetical protein
MRSARPWVSARAWGPVIPITGFCAGFSLVALALCLWRNPKAYVVAVVASVVIYYSSTIAALGRGVDRHALQRR